MLILAGPMQAVINAQASSALSTVSFIKEVGFTAPEDPDAENSDTNALDVKYVSFSYSKTVPDTVNGGVMVANRVLTIPFLAMLPIPNLEVSGAQPEAARQLVQLPHWQYIVERC